MEEREARALLVQAEEIEFPAELAVVTLCSLLKHVEVGIQILLLVEGSSVDALQHLVLLAAAPVCAGDALQLERLDLARGHDVRPRAEIRELPLRIGGDRLVLGQIFDQLHLVILALCTEIFDRLIARNLTALELQILLDDLLHFLFDVAQVGIRQLALKVKIIVEAVLDGRADGELYIAFGIETLDRLCHDMRCRMTQRMTSSRILKGQHLKRSIMRHRCRQVDGLAVEACRKRLLCE